MVDPISTGSIIIVGDLWTRGIDAIYDQTAKKLDDLHNAASRIEAAIDNQNRAHLEAALLAIKDGDLEPASQGLRMAVSLNLLNIAAWGLYAETMMRRNNMPRAREIYKEMLEIFGGHSPAIPFPIRQAYTQHAAVTFHGTGEKTIKIERNCHVTWQAVSRAGLLVTSETLDSPSHSTVSTDFFPWNGREYSWGGGKAPIILHCPGSVKNSYYSPNPVYSSALGSGWAERTIYCATDRLAVFTDGTIFDLDAIANDPESQIVAEEKHKRKIDPALLPKIFGEPLFGVNCQPYPTPRGVKVSVEQNEKQTHVPAGFFRSAHTKTTYNPTIIATIFGGKLRVA